MLTERLMSTVVRGITGRYLNFKPTAQVMLPPPNTGRRYMLYLHIPFCESLCPYCSFNRFPFSEARAVPYFEDLRAEMRMLKNLGYDFASLYIGGGTPTVMIDELCATIDLARALFSIEEVSGETNPNHLIPLYLDKLEGRVQRLSVGVQSFDDGLLRQMDRYEKYGSAKQIFERIVTAQGRFKSLNVDMIFNFPSQTEDMLSRDLTRILESGASQTTFYPLMASPAVEQSLARTVGKVDYGREARYYDVISEVLTGGENPAFSFGSAWTFNARIAKTPPQTASITAAPPDDAMIDEYIVDYEEYPAIGSGGLSFLEGSLYVNTFSLREYAAKIAAGTMSLMGKTTFSKRDRMRYRFMMQLFGLRLDKRQWRRDFGCTVLAGVPAEYAFFKTAGAFATDDENAITLTPKGRYLLVALMRQFFIGVNGVRDLARAVLPEDERELIFGEGV